MGAMTYGLGAELFDKEIIDFSIDSRTVGEGELFFALSQPDYERAGFNGTFADAHDFLAQARDSKARANRAARHRRGIVGRSGAPGTSGDDRKRGGDESRTDRRFETRRHRRTKRG